MKRLVLTGFAALAMTSAAFAADITVKASPPPISPVMSWTGFYAGFNVGGSWNERANVDQVGSPGLCDLPAQGCAAVPSFADTAATASTFSSGFGNKARFIGGVQAGANYQIANTRAVIGVEVDIQGLNGRDDLSVTKSAATPAFPGQDTTYTGTFNSHIEYFGTARGRVGYAFAPTFLAYATGGFAYAGVRYSAIDTLSSAVGVPVGGSTTTNISATLNGYTVGGGFEWKFKPNWSLKAEYLYYDLGRISYGTSVTQFGIGFPTGPFGGANMATTVGYRGDIVRVGLNYHFGVPVVANY